MVELSCFSFLVTDRALLLIGEPGTAKSWLSEHLAAAINGNSTRLCKVQLEQQKNLNEYSWNYAMLEGPTRKP